MVRREQRSRRATPMETTPARERRAPRGPAAGRGSFRRHPFTASFLGSSRRRWNVCSRREDRCVRPESPFWVEVPRAPLGVGADLEIRPVWLGSSDRTTLALSATDSYRDRLAAFIRGSDRQGLAVGSDRPSQGSRLCTVPALERIRGAPRALRGDRGGARAPEARRLRSLTSAVRGARPEREVELRESRNGGAEGIRIPTDVRLKGKLVGQLTPSSNAPGDSNTLVSWLRKVAALRQAA